MKTDSSLFCISITHKQAPAEVRRAFAFDGEAQRAFLREGIRCGADGVVLVSTCNRVEVYVSGKEDMMNRTERLLAKNDQEQCRMLRRYCREYHGADAVRHLFHVCAGLDSMVIGEDEILGQIREAYKCAEEEQAADFYIHTVFQRAIECAKRVKTDTCLSKSSVSIATLAASEITHFCGAPTVLLIGLTGQMGGLIAKDLAGRQGIRIFATVRQHSQAGASGWKLSAGAAQNPDTNLYLIPYDDRYAYLEQADAVVSATKSPHYTLTYEACRQSMHTGKKRLFLDIAVPNDIDPDIGQLSGAVLKGIDYFQTLAQKNNEKKQAGVLAAENIIEEHLNETMKVLAFHDFLPKLGAMNDIFEHMSARQLFFALKDAASDEELRALLHMSAKLLEEEK